MEKKNITAKELMETLCAVQVKPGEAKAGHRKLAETLDGQVDQFIKQVQEAGLADAEYRSRDIFPSADVRTAAFEEDIRQQAEWPESLFPMAADVLCRKISRWFRKELGLFVWSAKLGSSLEVEVSGGITAPSSSFDDPVSAKSAHDAKVARLMSDGWIFSRRSGRLEITDVPSNLEKIRQYVAVLEGQHIKIDLWDGVVHRFSFRIPSRKCRDVFFRLPDEEEKKPQERGETLSEDEAAVIQRNVKDLRFALGRLPYMKDKSVILSLLRSYTADIEKALGTEDLTCAQTVRRIHAEEASKNQTLRARQEAKGQEAMASLDLLEAYQKIEQALQKVFCPLGLWVAESQSFDYASTRLEAKPLVFCGGHALQPGLKTVQEPGDHVPYLLNDPDNFAIVEAVVTEVMPKAKLESIDVSVRSFGQIIQGLKFTIEPSDIASLLEKTKDIPEVEMF